MRKTAILSIAAMVLLIFTQVPVHAVLFGFENITANDAANAAVGEAQLSVDVTGWTEGRVSFYFSNTGPAASSITDVYFDDSVGILSGITISDMTIINGSGVLFSPGASPGGLPGGNNLSSPLEFTNTLSADSEPPAPQNGVNPGENLRFIFDMMLDDAIAALGDGSLRIGIHVQAFADGGSESFVSVGNGATPVPEPSTILLLSCGLFGLVLESRRRFKKKIL